MLVMMLDKFKRLRSEVRGSGLVFIDYFWHEDLATHLKSGLTEFLFEKQFN